MSFARQSLVTFGARLLVSLINLPISMLIVRTLGVEGQGVYSASVTLTTLWAVMGLLGIDAAHTYLLAGGRAPLGRILANSILLTLLLAAALVPSYIFFAGAVAGDEARDFARHVRVTSVAVPLILARYFLLSLFLGRKRIDAFNILTMLSSLSLLGLVILFVAAMGMGTSGAVLAYVLSAGLLAAAGAVWILRWLRDPSAGPLRPSMSSIRFSLAYGLKGHLVTVLSQFNYRFDMILVIRWLGLAAQGYYSVAVILAEKLTHITASVQLVLFPWISGMSKEEADELTPRACRHTLFWVTAAGALLFLLGPFLLDLLYTSELRPALGAFRILIPGVVALCLSKLLSADLSGRNRRGLPTVAMAVAFSVNLLLNVLLIPRHGIVGAAWASTASYTTQTVLTVAFFRRVSGVRLSSLIIPRADDVRAYGRLARRLIRRGGWPPAVSRILPPPPPLDPEGPA